MYRRRLRRARKSGVAFDLYRLCPPPDGVLTADDQLQLHWQSTRWGTKWNVWDIRAEPLHRLPNGGGRLTYSFISAWAEPLQAIRAASMHHSRLCFILAAVEAGAGDFTSHLIHRGRRRTWRMPEAVADLVAHYEVYDGQEYYDGYQPGVMAALVHHWDAGAAAVLARLPTAETHKGEASAKSNPVKPRGRGGNR